MGYKRFGLSVTLQVALILTVCIVIAYLAVVVRYYASALVMLIILTVQVAYLLHHIKKTDRELTRFMLAIRYQDLSQSFALAQDNTGPHAQLSAAFEEILQRFREARSAKEEQASYLHTLVQHVPVAVMALDEAGNIDLFNSAARQLLGVQALRNLHDYSSFGPDFPARILALQSGERQLVKVTRDTSLLQLNVLATELRIRGRDYKIVSLQDIHGELETREIEAWQNLIRVLTHEIMNSVTPISSLATTATELLAEARQVATRIPALDDVEDAVDTIAKRSAGLMHFVESYRRLTRIPQPALQSVQVAELFNRIRQLMGPELNRRGIAITHSVEPHGLAIQADPDLIEQALINLIRNAIDAVSAVAQPRIQLIAQLSPTGRPALAVEDNGNGMDEHVRANIFVPFFTTKRHGSGVGLSLVRQIMRSHCGHIGVHSAPGAGTVVRLTFQ